MSDNTTEAFHDGKENSHNNQDSKDERSIKNTLAAQEHDNRETKVAEKKAEKEEDDDTKPREEMKRGARIDAELEDEEEELIRKMDEKKAQKEAAKKS